MAVLRLVSGPASRNTYDRVVAAMKLHTEHPLGLILHGANLVDGEIQVTQVWDSAEYALRFEEEILGPVLAAHGVSAAREVKVVELCDLVTP
ncbi:MAG TPA: hypothetical protein VNV44_15355 [Solirubrobacteraceae bacterium]|jgi:hypothetical protein|nr:hypothetical protein [Solirubrobacteraceae bacterium]